MCLGLRLVAACVLLSGAVSAHWAWAEIELKEGMTEARLFLGLFPDLQLKGEPVEKVVAAKLWLLDGDYRVTEMTIHSARVMRGERWRATTRLAPPL